MRGGGGGNKGSNQAQSRNDKGGKQQGKKHDDGPKDAKQRDDATTTARKATRTITKTKAPATFRLVAATARQARQGRRAATRHRRLQLPKSIRKRPRNACIRTRMTPTTPRRNTRNAKSSHLLRARGALRQDDHEPEHANCYEPYYYSEKHHACVKRDGPDIHPVDCRWPLVRMGDICVCPPGRIYRNGSCEIPPVIIVDPPRGRPPSYIPPDGPPPGPPPGDSGPPPVDAGPPPPEST